MSDSKKPRDPSSYTPSGLPDKNLTRYMKIGMNDDAQNARYAAQQRALKNSLANKRRPV